jgi:hypothetical protein
MASLADFDRAGGAMAASGRPTQESCAERAGASAIRAAIISQFERVASDQEKRLAPLADDLVLLDSGIDSLCFAIIVANLEDDLGLDPFTTSDGAYLPVTFGDFVGFYEREAA